MLDRCVDEGSKKINELWHWDEAVGKRYFCASNVVRALDVCPDDVVKVCSLESCALLLISRGIKYGAV